MLLQSRSAAIGFVVSLLGVIFLLLGSTVSFARTTPLSWDLRRLTDYNSSQTLLQSFMPLELSSR